MQMSGQPGSQNIYNREPNALVKLQLPVGVAANNIATIALTDIGLSAGASWTYAEQISGWEANLTNKTVYHVCAIVGDNLVVTEGTDTWTDGEVLYIRVSRLPLIGNTPTMS